MSSTKYASRPRIGLIPCFWQALYSSIEPFITPWSVSPSAGWSNSAARAARPSILQAPSSSEYSEWTWRCTAAAKATPSMRSRSDGAGNDPALWGFLDYGRGMGLILALAVAVAGGNLVVTTAPEKVHSG